MLARETLIADVWPADAPSQRVVDTTLKRLRRKLPAVGRRIRTIRGVGYELTADDTEPTYRLRCRSAEDQASNASETNAKHRRPFDVEEP